MSATGWTLPRALEAAARTRSGVHFVQEDGRESFESYEELRLRASSIARHLAEPRRRARPSRGAPDPGGRGLHPLALRRVDDRRGGGAARAAHEPRPARRRPRELAAHGAHRRGPRRRDHVPPSRGPGHASGRRADGRRRRLLGRPRRGPGRRPRRRAAAPRGPRPVHLGIDVTAEGRGAGAREPGRQRRGHHGPGRHRRLGPRRGRELAAALPRHGAHRGRDRLGATPARRSCSSRRCCS